MPVFLLWSDVYFEMSSHFYIMIVFFNIFLLFRSYVNIIKQYNLYVNNILIFV